MKISKCKIAVVCLTLTIAVTLCACSVTKNGGKDSEAPKQDQQDVTELPEIVDKTPEEEPTANTFPGPDSTTLVNPRGDTVDVTKQSDGTYIDANGTVYTFDGTSVWTDKDGHDWDEIAK